MAMTEDEHSQVKFKTQTDAPLKGLLDRVEDISGGQTVDLKTVIEALGNRSFGPVLLLCGLFLLTPLGMLPGVPMALGVIIILFSAQLLFRKSHPWMPKFLRRVKVTAKSLEKARKFAGPWLDRIDNVVRPRLQWAARGPMLVVTALVAILLAVTMLPLGAVPFGVVVPGFIIGLMGLGITGRDGVFILLGLVLSFAVLVMIFQMVL
ncbi:exopolysaccharide biosynthesis protein [Litorimonas haliclonae]|uniref:exopolysaccharide biosynthesis protein n=1 Tax=Litorimonas haliclonae TaxID=2081977 RepID=UPI0039EEE29B